MFLAYCVLHGNRAWLNDIPLRLDVRKQVQTLQAGLGLQESAGITALCYYKPNCAEWQWTM